MKLNSFVLTLLSLVAQLCIPDLVFSQYDYPTANLSTTWTNHVSDPNTATFNDGSTVRPILVRGTFDLEVEYACGFFCNGSCEKYLVAIFIVPTYDPFSGFPKVVWSPNRNHPVSLNSTLQLTSDGDLVLTDVDGAISWSTNTSGKSVVGLNMTEIGNLVLFNSKNETVWQSFDHPSDALVPGQKLIAGQHLTSSVSETNWTQSVFSLSVSSKGLFAFIEADPPQTYYSRTVTGNKSNNEPSYIKFVNGSLSMYIHVAEPSDPDHKQESHVASSVQYMKLEADGHLRVYEWGKGTNGGWGSVADLLTGYLDDCSYPMGCGAYGICSNGQCACPAATNNGSIFFYPIYDRQPALGCRETLTLSCGASQYHEFVEVTNATYFTFISDIGNTDMETCKEACLKNCSCKAAMFRYGSNSSDGECYLPSNIFSLMNNDKVIILYNSTAFLKVQGSAPTTKKNSSRVVIIGASIGAFVGLFLLGGVLFIVIGRKKKEDADEEEYLDQVPGMPTRFSYEELKIATEDFIKKLGEGGFGSVFEGKLSNGTLIAVKVLDGVGHIKKSFLAEVETIGSIHHINLVTLIGFSAEKSHRALVYEYMPNGSLEKWIFKPKAENMLDWKQRRNIILDIAKGLSYIKKRGKLVSLSEQELVDCDVNGVDQGCSGGEMEDAFQFIINNKGLNTEANYPYTASDGTCDKKAESTYAAKITGYETVPANSEDALLQAVANQPIAVSIDASGFAFQLYSSGVFNGECGTDLDHGVTAVGYGVEDGVKYWIVKNSWGTGWGENGYIRMQRGVDAKEGLCGIAMDSSYPTA
ncbi:unnamed protein product [Rhodiola kirilowii]